MVGPVDDVEQQRQDPGADLQHLQPARALPDKGRVIEAAVDGGDYASTSEVVREALREWKLRRGVQERELAALKADIDKGLADLAAGMLLSS